MKSLFASCSGTKVFKPTFYLEEEDVKDKIENNTDTPNLDKNENFAKHSMCVATVASTQSSCGYIPVVGSGCANGYIPESKEDNTMF